MIKRKKYRGTDPFKKLLNNPKHAEKIFRIYYIATLWLWISIIIGSIIFIYWAVKYLSSIT